MATKPKPRPLVQFLEARFEYLRCMHKGDANELPDKLKTESLAGILTRSKSDSEIQGKWKKEKEKAPEEGILLIVNGPRAARKHR